VLFVSNCWAHLPKKALCHWFLTADAPPTGDVNKFPGGVSPCAPYHVESLINKFTNKYISIVLTAYLKSGA